MTGRMLTTLALLLALAHLSQACAGEAPAPDAEEPSPPGAGPASGPTGGTVHAYAYLEDDVRRLLDFLRGDASVPADALADSVTLYVAPEGGGERRTLSREALRAPTAWRVGEYSFVPPAGLEHVTLLPGLHSNCHGAPLETRSPELARFPHVGVRLVPDDYASCLQSWNATFVFSDDAAAPRLTAVVYDQWEWG